MKLKKILSEVICTYDNYIEIGGDADLDIITKVGDTITMDEGLVAVMEMLEVEEPDNNEIVNEILPSGPILDFDRYIAEKRTKRKHVSPPTVDDWDEEDMEEEE